jgi:hypothetical protein
MKMGRYIIRLVAFTKVVGNGWRPKSPKANPSPQVPDPDVLIFKVNLQWSLRLIADDHYLGLR